MAPEIVAETDADADAVEMLYDLAFGAARRGLSSYRLRDGVAPAPGCCFVARDAAAVVGAIRGWPVQVGGQAALLLGPVAVHPTRQGEGLGALLIAAQLDAAPTEGWQAVLLVGDAPYYKRFGFQPLGDRVQFPPPTNPARVLGKGLIEGGLDGITGRVMRAGQ